MRGLSRYLSAQLAGSRPKDAPSCPPEPEVVPEVPRAALDAQKPPAPRKPFDWEPEPPIGALAGMAPVLWTVLIVTIYVLAVCNAP